MSNVHEVVHLLCRLNELFPNGCTPNQFADFEEGVRKDGNFPIIPFLTNLIDEKMVVARGKLLHITEDVLGSSFIRLRKNFCSNFYRLLISRSGVVTVKETLDHKEYLTSAPITKENILSLCNRYPLLFSLDSSASEDYKLDSAVIRLNSEIPDWIVVLDSQANKIEGAECDCQECTK